MDPNAVAQQFITAYGTFLTSGNVAGMSALYGADSTVIYDGTIARGQGAITSTFVAPRLAGGVKMRLSGHSVQGTATGHLLISMDGEFDKPPGHFHVVILLGPTPAGGMYIKAELGRWGAGAAAQQFSLDTSGLTMPFLQSYYGEYQKTPRAGILGMYHPAKSQLSMGETSKFPPSVGRAAIEPMHMGTPAVAPDTEAKPPRMAPGGHELLTVDALPALEAGAAPVNGISAAVLILVTGRIRLQGEANPLNFMHAFLVATEAGANYVANEMFNLIYA